jgi:hypothetical protein
VPQRFIVEEYKRNYFSGNQAKVYFDNEYVGEVVYLEYNITTNKSPIYSYNSEQFRMVAKGNMLVQGNFAINFTEVGYLLKIANNIRRTKIIQDQQNKDKVVQTLYRNTDINSMEGILKFVTVHDKGIQADMINWYRDKFWGDVANTSMAGKEYMLHPWEFDRDDYGNLSSKGFTITVTFGVPNTHPNMFSLKTIQDVHVSGESMVLQPTGQGLIEQYPFFARVIDEDISHYEPVKEVHDMQKPATTSSASDKSSVNSVSNITQSKADEQPQVSPIKKAGDQGVPVTFYTTVNTYTVGSKWTATITIETLSGSDIIINNVLPNDFDGHRYGSCNATRIGTSSVILAVNDIDVSYNDVVVQIAIIEAGLPNSSTPVRYHEPEIVMVKKLESNQYDLHSSRFIIRKS